MKKIVVLLMCLFFVAGFCKVAVSENEVLDFTLVNKTGVNIHALHVSPSKVNEWEANILPTDTVLEDGQMVEVKFTPEHTATLWDLRVDDKDGNYLYWYGLDLSKIEKITLHFDKEKGEGTAEIE